MEGIGKVKERRNEGIGKVKERKGEWKLCRIKR